jgi:hypothetical protein
MSDEVKPESVEVKLDVKPIIQPPKLAFQDVAWNEIKNIETNAFSLKNQPISNWAKPIPNNDSQILTLVIRVQALVSIIINIFNKNTKYKCQNTRTCIVDGSLGTTVDIVSINSDIKEPLTMEENPIWISIANIDIAVYSMPNQLVSKYFVPLFTNKENTILIYTSNYIAVNSFKEKLPSSLKIISDIPFVYNQKSGVLLELVQNV